jgi:hypothetical protein
MSYETRQAEAIDKFLEGLGVPEDERGPHRLIFLGADAAGGACQLCGHAPIKYRFHLADKEKGGSIIAGSECIVNHKFIPAEVVAKVKTSRKRLEEGAKYPASEAQIRFIRSLLKQANQEEPIGLDAISKDMAKREITRLKKLLAIDSYVDRPYTQSELSQEDRLHVEWAIRELESLIRITGRKEDKLLEMLRTLLDKGWAFTEGRKDWTRKTIERQREWAKSF